MPLTDDGCCHMPKCEFGTNKQSDNKRKGVMMDSQAAKRKSSRTSWRRVSLRKSLGELVGGVRRKSVPNSSSYRGVRLLDLDKIWNHVLQAKLCPETELYVLSASVQQVPAGTTVRRQRRRTSSSRASTRNGFEASAVGDPKRIIHVPVDYAVLKPRKQWNARDVFESLMARDNDKNENETIYELQDIQEVGLPFEGIAVIEAEQGPLGTLVDALYAYFEVSPDCDAENAFVWLEAFQPALSTMDVGHFNQVAVYLGNWEGPSPLFNGTVLHQLQHAVENKTQMDFFFHAEVADSVVWEILSDPGFMVERVCCSEDKNSKHQTALKLKIEQWQCRLIEQHARMFERKRSVETALFLQRAGRFMVAAKELQVGKSYFERAVELLESDASHTATRGSLWEDLGMVCEQQDDLSGAAQMYENALAVYQTNPVDYHESLAACHAKLGELAEQTQNLHVAVQHYLAFLSLHKTCKDDRDAPLVRMYVFLHEFSMQRGEFDQAYSSITRALEIQRYLTSTTSPQVARSLARMANALCGLNQFRAATEIYHDALETLKELEGEDVSNVLTDVYLSLGDLHLQQLEFDEAFAMYQSALETTSKRTGDLRSQRVAALFGMGTILENQGQVDKAIEMFERAIQAAELSSDAEKDQAGAFLAGIAFHLGLLFLQHSKLKEAKAAFSIALQAYQVALGDGHLLTQRARARLDQLSS